MNKLYKTTHLNGDPRCPNCNMIADKATSAEGWHEPDPDAVNLSVCFGCLSILEIRGNTLVMADLRDTPLSILERLLFLQSSIGLVKRKSN